VGAPAFVVIEEVAGIARTDDGTRAKVLRRNADGPLAPEEVMRVAMHVRVHVSTVRVRAGCQQPCRISRVAVPRRPRQTADRRARVLRLAG
jgi:hypothetical protein